MLSIDICISFFLMILRCVRELRVVEYLPLVLHICIYVFINKYTWINYSAVYYLFIILEDHRGVSFH